MKIAFFDLTRLESGGGVAKYFIETSTNLIKRNKNLHIDIISLDKKTLRSLMAFLYLYNFGKQDRYEKDKESRENIVKRLGKVKYYNVPFTKLKKSLQKYDLIYTVDNFLIVILFKYFFGYRNLPKIIYSFHIPVYYVSARTLQLKIHNFLNRSIFYKYALDKAYKLHVINSFDENYLRNKLDLKNVYKIYYPFDFKNFKRRNSFKYYDYKWDKRVFNVIWVGRLTEDKGVMDLMNIINYINTTDLGKGVVWNIFGDGELTSTVRNLSLKCKNVNYHGYIENCYLPDIMSNNDLFISTSKRECFPYSILEAQSIGLPVLSFEIPGAEDIIDNGINGYLVENLKEYKRMFVNIINNKSFSKYFIKKYIANKFNFEIILGETYNLFMEAIRK